MKRLFFVNVLFIAILFTPFGFSYAQESDAQASSGQIEEILVTATRRAETDILTTPVAMTAKVCRV